MKVSDILNEEQHYQILSVEQDNAPAQGTSNQGTINANYHALVKAFGEPANHIQDDRADVNYVWDLLIKYKDPLNDDHQKHDDDHDFVDVSIYDYRYGEDDRYTNPTTINRWTVGAKSRTGLWVLDDLLQQKGIK